MAAVLTSVASIGVGMRPAMTDDVVPQDVVPAMTATDTAGIDSLLTDTMQQEAPEPFRLYQSTRAYGDRIVLRWMPSEYVPFFFGSQYGYEIIRIAMTKESTSIDTLEHCLKPWPLEKFRERFVADSTRVGGPAHTDTLGVAAAQAVYGRSVSLDQTEKAPGTPGSIVEVWEQQQDLFGFGALVADMRPDLAEAMALGYTDRNVKKGVTYTYIVHPLVPQEKADIRVMLDVPRELGDYTPVPFDVQLTDSVKAPGDVQLMWQQTSYSAYNIERRQISPVSTPWQRINEQPYISLQPDDSGIERDNAFADPYLDAGTYEYRITAIDLFGEETTPCTPHTVVVPDLVGPTVPNLYHIDILRGDTTVHALLQWTKDTLETDFVGYIPMYNLPRIMGDSWFPLTKDLVDRERTECKVSVRGLETGRICIAAVDTAGNVSYSMPREIRIGDVKAPSAPTNLRYTTEIGTPEEVEARNGRGLIRLTWDEPADRDIDYYEVFFANDPTHTFMRARFDGKMRDCQFVDTVSLSVNQKYIYYKVRAIDYSTNEGEWSDIFQVERPSLVVPSVPHLHESSQDLQAIHQTWVVGAEVQIARHYVYRRLEGEKEWTLLAVCDADSVKAAGYRITFDDRPRAARGHWEYALESETASGILSGKSLIYSVKFNAYRRIPCPVHLDGDCLNDKQNETRLVWEVTGELPDCEEWYYCIYRKGPKDDDFKFLLAAKKDELSFSDYLIRPGESAQYYIKIRMPGIGESEDSNVITVHAKEKQ